MTLSYRPMRLKDVHECVDIIASDGIARPKYGSTILWLRSVWSGLLGCEAFRAVVFEELKRSQAKILGVGVSAIVSDQFLRELKTPPFFWVGPEITERVRRGESPLLSNRQVREANANSGVNVVVWEGAVRAGEQSRPEVHNFVMSTFMEQHRGFLLKELWGHGVSSAGLKATVNSGTWFLMRADGSHVDHLDRPAEEILAEPHIIGLTRELALGRIGTWSSSLFIYQPPRFDFRPSEQRLLLTALRGGTDEDLADELGLSLSTVKKTWRLIYDRVAARDPDLVPDAFPPEEGSPERGRGKKQRLLVYLREHLEELRPAAP
jgi:DNA-binding NarL/FixJ family response regulator